MQEQSAADIKSKFKIRFIKQLTVAVILFPIILALIFGNKNGGTSILGMEAEIFGVFAIILMVVALVFSFLIGVARAAISIWGEKSIPNFVTSVERNSAVKK